LTEKFLNELEELKEDVSKMGELAVQMLCGSMDALKDRDDDKAEWVLSKKSEITDMDSEIEKRAFRLTMLYQPMAKDMRTLACILKMITYLQRIGRYAKDIANIEKELGDKPHIAKLVHLPREAQMVCKMIEDSLEAFRTENLSLIEDLNERDSEVDALRYSIFRECLTYMMEDPKNITRCTHYVMIARYLERCGDHACKIAEKVHFMATGERIEIG